MDTRVQIETSAKIAALNDKYRQGTQFAITPGVQEMRDCLGLIQAVREYGNFNEDNDPYGEHDFGTLDWFGSRIFWKIDYYDDVLEKWCDPLSSECRRVLTIMKADEY